jgi:hypothetical protein
VLHRSKQLYLRFDYEGVPISGSLDALATDGSPVEVKSYYGDKQEREMLTLNRPKTSYLKQLAIYMYHLDKSEGYLYMAPMPAGKHLVFKVNRVNKTMFECNGYSFDLLETFQKWQRLYNSNILTKTEPSPFADNLYYKHDVNSIDFTKLSKSLITEMRANRKVHGDWQILYSSYKDLWIERQGTTLGYTDQEMALILSATQGFTTWKK